LHFKREFKSPACKSYALALRAGLKNKILVVILAAEYSHTSGVARRDGVDTLTPDPSPK